MSADYIQGYSKLQKEQIEGLDARLTSAQNAINSNKTSYDSMVAANDNKNVEQDTRLTALDNMTNGRVKVTEDRATALEGRATTLESRATNLEAGTTDLNSQTTALRTRASALETRAGALEGRATALEGRASTIESTAATFRATYDSKMTALDNKDTELLNNINTRVLQTDYNTKTASLDALNTAMNKRFFAVEEFIRTMLGTYGIQEKDANGNVISSYQYTGAIQNLSIANGTGQPDTNVFKVVKKEADGSNWKLHLQLTTYAYNQLASGQIKVVGGTGTAAQSAFTYNSTSKYYEGVISVTGAAPYSLALESTVGGILFTYTVTQAIFDALPTFNPPPSLLKTFTSTDTTLLTSASINLETGIFTINTPVVTPFTVTLYNASGSSVYNLLDYGASGVGQQTYNVSNALNSFKNSGASGTVTNIGVAVNGTLVTNRITFWNPTTKTYV